MNASWSLPGSSGARVASSASSWRFAASSWRDVPPGVRAQVRAQRGRCADPAEQRGHRPVPQQVHVVDAVRPADHPGDQAADLQLGVDSARAARPDELRDQLGQSGPLRQCHDRDQAGPRHEIRVVERCVRLRRACNNRTCKVSSRTRRQKLQKLPSSQFRGHLSHLTRQKQPYLRGGSRLSFGCANWAVRSAIRFANEFHTRLGIEPVYAFLGDNLEYIVLIFKGRH